MIHSTIFSNSEANVLAASGLPPMMVVAGATSATPFPASASASRLQVTTNSTVVSDPRFMDTSSMLAQALARTAPRRPRGEKKPIPDDQKDDRYYERRKRNNLAAKKSRDQRKMREDAIAMRATYLEKENAVLRTQVSALRDERHSLQGLLLRRQLHQKQREMLNLVAEQQQRQQLQCLEMLKIQHLRGLRGRQRQEDERRSPSSERQQQKEEMEEEQQK